MDECYIGAIMPWAVSWAPMNWELCNGQSLPIAQYQALYSLIGTTYGSQDSQHFNLPDLRGRFPIGAGTCVAGDKDTYVIGQTTGNSDNITLTPQNVPLAAHVHKITSTATCTGGGSVPVSLPIDIPVNPDTSAVLTNSPTGNMLATAKLNANPLGVYTNSATSTTANLKSFTASTNITVPTPTATVTSVCDSAGTTQAQAFSIKPNSLCINYIICLNGLYPSRP